jgi:hypothetical protein
MSPHSFLCCFCSVGRRLSDALAELARDMYLASHWVRVDLTHICAAVVYLDIGDVQFPSVMAVVSHREPRVVSHHMRLDGEDGLRIGLDPRHLHERTCFYFHEKKQNKAWNMCIISMRQHRT